MTESNGGCTRFFTIGCVGCLGLTALLIVVSALTFGIAWFQAQEVGVSHQELTRDVTAPEVSLEAKAGVALPVDLSEVPAAGTVELNLNQTEFEVRPGAPGEPLRVDARFDSSHYTLTEEFNEGDGDQGWTYRIAFRRSSGSGLLAGLRELISRSQPRVVIVLPPDVPFDLDLSVMRGGGEVELGGLWLTNIDVEFLQGGGHVAVSEPLRSPAEQVRIGFSMGGGEVEGLGNASPRRLDIEFSMGGGDVDLRGAWSRNARISIDQSMGGASVQLPREVDIRGLDRPGALASPGLDEVPRPVLTFDVSSRFGELEFLD
jgi:hypothetical protein